MLELAQPVIIYITTADFDRSSICNEKYDYAVKVRDGIIADPAFLPVIYEADREDDWTSPEVWRRANPNLGISISEEYLERECQRARETPTYENTFKRLHLNMPTQQDIRWLQMEKWDACGRSSIDEASLEGKRCFAGLDLSTTTDVTALVLLFTDPADTGQHRRLPATGPGPTDRYPTDWRLRLPRSLGVGDGANDARRRARAGFIRSRRHLVGRRCRCRSRHARFLR